MPPLTVDDKFWGAKLDVAVKPEATRDKSEPVIPITAEAVVTTIAELASVVVTVITLSPTCWTLNLTLALAFDVPSENSDVEIELSGLLTNQL